MSGAPGAPAGEEGNFHDAVLKTFVEFYDRGLIFRGKRLVNWDPHFETAISDLEVEQVEVKGHLWRLRYPLENGARGGPSLRPARPRGRRSRSRSAGPS